MGSGLIYAIIVVLWAIVLVPMWLRRHDAETESRSVDRFSSAMKILSRRPGGRSRQQGPRSVVLPPMTDSSVPLDLDTPADGAERPAFIKPTRRPLTAPAPQIFVSRPTPRASTQMHFRRRRTILVALALLLVVAAAVFAVGVVGLWVPLLAFAMAGGYLALMMASSASTRRQAEAQRRQQQRQGRRGGVVEAPTAWHETIVLGRLADAAAPGAAPEVGVGQQVADSGWQPTSIPVPTYVTAPAASVLPREIDRRHAGAWDAQGMLDQAAAVRADAARSHEIDARPTGDDVWTSATAASGDDAVFDREWFESDFDGTSAEQIAEDDAVSYQPRRRAVNE